MKKILIFIIISITAFGQVWTQSLADAEYYFDSDPGVGNGIAISITPGDDITESYNFSVSPLGPGFHNLFIRVRDDLGRWSLVRRHLFYVYDDSPMDLSKVQADLVGFEYFFDKDAGVGTGTWVPDSPGADLEKLTDFSTSSVGPGMHQLLVRARDASGKWGHVSRHLFHVFDDALLDLSKIRSKIVAAEYFFNKDTVQQGQGVSIPITPGNEIEWTGGILVEGLEAGEHTLFIRVQDSIGTWSIVATEKFNVINLGSETNSPICQGSSDGTATVSMEGGKPPFTYLWDDPQQQKDSTAIGLRAGSYTVTVTDVAGSVIRETLTVTEYDTIQINISTADTQCGTSEGSATAIVSGNNPPFNYLWTSGSDESSATDLASGFYVVTVTDNIGCSNTALAEINDIGGPVISLVGIQNLDCNGDENGIIDVNVSGGKIPYEYSWSNGEITQDILNLPGGPYELTVTDADECKAVQSITVEEPAPITAASTVTSTDCGLTNGSIKLNISGGTPLNGGTPYAISWEGLPTPHKDFMENVGAGVYKATIVDNNSCVASYIVSVSAKNAPVVTVTSITPSDCGANNGSVVINVAGGSGSYTYKWSKNGISAGTSKDLTGVGPGEYTVEVNDGSSCLAYANATIAAELPPRPSICLVTVDSLTGRNRLVWNKESGQGITSYNIYRETSSAGVFNFIANIPFDSLSTYVDLHADPINRSWRYKVSAVGDCGESVLSLSHKTMHLTLTLGLLNSVNLRWNHYEGFIPKENTYHIWRWAASTGLTKITQVPSNLNSYSDFAVPDEDVWYYVESEHPTGCSPLKAATLNSTRSNRKDKLKSVIGIESIVSEFGISVWPNPSSGQFNLSLNYKRTGDLKIKVFDISGKLVYLSEMNDLSNSVEILLDLSGYARGMYQMHIDTGTGIYNKVLIIQ